MVLRPARRLVALLAAAAFLGGTQVAAPGAASAAEPASSALPAPGDGGTLVPPPAAAAVLARELRGGLARIAERGGEVQAGAPGTRSLVEGMVTASDPRGLSIAVSIRVTPETQAATRRAIVAAGATIANETAGTLEAYLPAGSIAALPAIAGVEAVEPIRPPIGHAFVSPAVQLLGADAWQSRGYTGAGVKVGIIDTGFAGYGALMGSDLPATVHARCYSSIGRFGDALSACDAGGDRHGTAVAESVADVAPEASLYISNPISRLDEIRSVEWMTAQGVRIINASWTSGSVFEGPGDGTSRRTDSSYATLDRAVSGGALWVNAAGNAGEDGWIGAWTDPDSSGWLHFAGSDTRNRLDLQEGTSVTVALRWNDPWGKARDDYDLFLYRGTTAVASSTDVQDGSGDPLEVLDYTATKSGEYAVAVRKRTGKAVTRLQVLVQTEAVAPLQYSTPDDTLPAPADSSNPGVLTVGAVNLDRPNVIASYSSQGPTLDGRTKPDLVAPDCAGTRSEPQFCGTSQAAPFVAGAAALLLQQEPGLGPVALATAIRSRVAPLGTPVPNPTYGFGRLDLLPAPTTGPPPPPAPPAPTGVRTISSPGAGTAWQGLAMSGSYVHVVYTTGGNTVDYRRSSDGGATFASPIALSPPDGIAGLASVSAAGHVVVVAWYDGDTSAGRPVTLWVRRSGDDGSTWDVARRLTDASGRVGSPSVAVGSSGNVIVAWTDSVTGRILVAASADGGRSFAAARTIGTTALRPYRGLEDLEGSVSAAFGAGGTAYVAWLSSTSRVLLRRTTDGGTTWVKPVTIDTRATALVLPWVAASGPDVAIAYGAPSGTGAAAVFIRRSSDRGSHWTSRLRAAGPANGAEAPAIALKGTVIRLAYTACATAACSQARIMYRQSSNGGLTWSTDRALSASTKYSFAAGIAQGRRIYVLYATYASSASTLGTVYLSVR